jgi:hypothetical protein
MTTTSSLGAAPMTKIQTEPIRRVKKEKLTFKEYFQDLYNIKADTELFNKINNINTNKPEVHNEIV